MKKLLFYIISAVALVASCQKFDQLEQAAGDSTVTFTVNLPGSIASKAVADGEKAVKLYYATYTTAGKRIERLCNTSEGVAVTNKKATVTLQLVKDLKYDVVFWAQSPNCDAFTFDWDAKTMKVNYAGAANDDLRDAFYALEEDLYVVDGTNLPKTVYLRRPFAQINFGASDYDFVTDYYDATSVDAGMKSAFVSAEVPTTLNLLDRTIGTDVADVDFTLAGIPNDPRLLNVRGEDYKYVAMNYVLAPEDDQPLMLDKVTANFFYEHKDAQGTVVGKIDRTIPVENVPILRNHRTNILGDFFTEDAVVNIIVDEKFEEPDYNIYLPVKIEEVAAGTENSPTELENVMGNINANPVAENYVLDLGGGYVTWQTGGAHGSTPFIDEGSIVETITLNNGTLVAQGAGVGPIRLANGGTLILRDMTIVDESSSYAEGSWEFTYLEFDGKIECYNCVFKDPIAFDGDIAKFEGCTFASKTSEYGVWVSNGIASFADCKFEDFRGLKMHEQYGSEIASVTVDACEFGPLSEKPGVAVGTLNAETKVSITNSLFVNCQPGDQSLFIYETDTDVKTFDFVNKDNKVVTEKNVATVEELKTVLVGSGEAGAGNTNININADMDLSAVAWTPVKVDGYHGADIVTINGNGKTIKGLTAPLFAGGFAGGSGIVIKDLTITESDIVSTNTLGSGAFIESVDSMQEITLENCHLSKSTVTGGSGSRTGGLIGWTAGYSNVNDGPVKTYVTIKNCSVSECTITCDGSVGGLYGHAGNNDWTYSFVENCVVRDCNLNSTNGSDWRVGVVVGTANVGEVTINGIIESGNTLTQTGKTAPVGQSNLYGRFVPGTTGKLTIDGVAIQ